jgi:O-methyltransferase
MTSDAAAKARRMVQRVVERTPYRIKQALPPYIDPEDKRLLDRIDSYTMCKPPRILETIHATEYVVKSGIPGAIVECGVWRGGIMMAMALTLQRLGAGDRELFLYDTFQGMSAPTDRDVTVEGFHPGALWEERREGSSNSWHRASQDEVQRVLESTGYDPGRITYVKGKVEDTLPETTPDRIALLRLDTDFYESTRAELDHLFPLLERGGVLLIDDYGTWVGCRNAVDEYFARNGIRIHLSRTDPAGRSAIKQ